MWFGKPKPPVDTDTAEWIEDCFAWLLEHRKASAPFAETPLVLPTKQFFTRDGKSGHALALHVFEQVKEHAGMADWPCEIEAQEPDPDRRAGEWLTVQGGPQAPAGTFSIRSNAEAPLITYNPSLLDDPMGLVATFAHELGHYLTATIPVPPPGGPENEEYATEIASIFLGFGILVANASFKFAQFGDGFTQGWSYNRQGYFPPTELAYGLGVFVALRGEGEEDAIARLNADLRPAFKKSLKYLRATPVALQAIGEPART